MIHLIFKLHYDRIVKVQDLENPSFPPDISRPRRTFPKWPRDCGDRERELKMQFERRARKREKRKKKKEEEERERKRERSSSDAARLNCEEAT